eukprot:scaffold60788_cov15-Tisochrysis_lutea.AAC.3
MHVFCAQGYVDAMTDLICQELTKFSDPQSVELFFSAHGVPKSYVEEAGVYNLGCATSALHAWYHYRFDGRSD